MNEINIKSQAQNKGEHLTCRLVEIVDSGLTINVI